MIRFLIALILFLAPPDPHLQAQGNSLDSATISWTQQSRGCLYRNTTFISCYERPGSYVETFGAVGPLDAAYRPTAGDVYTLWTPEGVERAPLVARPVYLPVWRGA